MANRTVMVMAAGTGGHIVPGIAVAKELQQRGWKVVWLGTRRGMENKLVPPTGIPLERLNFHGVRGKGLLGSLKGALQLVGAFFKSGALIFRHRPDVVLGMGGYVCLPGGVMTGLLWKPLVLVNADASLLLSNRALLPFAKKLVCGFDGSAARDAKALVTGNPVRREIEAIAAPAERFAGRGGPLKVLVVGGSLGARILNETLPQAMAMLPAERRPQLTHQTGEANFAAVEAAYQDAGLRDQVELLPFVDDMPGCLAECDLVICRAGAITVSELCAAGVPSVLVPLVVSTTSHQRDNAEWMAQAGAAWHLPQTELNADKLASLLAQLDRDQLLDKAERARALARSGAAGRVAALCQQLAGDRPDAAEASQ
ncbi:undecaprenyldiphospho-muramoylpentapeptide beta-N-acetylglucosaminyltransferase [Chromobacterium sinusclupearum]|uniref:UDP-N-acetylglucosamine--N-acetylmuramyl-(pentapeptide) pyrophosphoryl-undecaprenol N-acetylglucosamine transferase n=1 Tax=Chromobacterium sinusclupearum TaxID=2077146 RepID=A0A2K4MJ22_9NEIS|nr:undecaprenyldiphospho-muramoylpentapeptide beta-N-acetylglucosaminyltransferase [Chromobacterium sinusclupearum]POA96989.1 undecaprenyldiphospho-muramoylpentapeptide beta-N-acetylglucosaminyltransferase [Chromobacterium sinusclupearum]